MTNQAFQAARPDLKVPADFNPFDERFPEDLRKAFWAAHWAANPNAAELYED